MVKEIYDNTDYYVGKTFQVKGMYYWDKEICLPNQAFIGRYMVVCCIADAFTVGFFVEMENMPKLKEGEWFQITAKLKKSQTTRGMLPVFEVLQFDKVEKAEAYIYPKY